MKIVNFVFSIISIWITFICTNAQQKTQVTLYNSVKYPVSIWWVGQADVAKIMDIPAQSLTTMDSFVGHRFFVMATVDGTPQISDKNRIGFTLTQSSDLRYDISNRDGVLAVGIVDPEVQNNEKIATQELSQEMIENCDNDVDCIIDSYYQDSLTDLVEKNVELHAKRSELATPLREYTCHDQNTQTTEPIGIEEWKFGGKNYTVEKILNRDDAKVYVLNDFVSENQCDELFSRSYNKMAYASVEGESPDKSIVSDARSAKAASVMPDMNNEDDVLRDLRLKIFQFATDYTGDNLTHHGQEPFQAIYYKHSDYYKPHCDGACDGRDFMSGGRVATIIVYCRSAEVGGFTTFTKANAQVRPKPHQAVFFSYKNGQGQKKKMEKDWTEHSACPVKDGEKFIATQWIRLGVNADLDYHNFSPKGDYTPVRIYGVQ